MTAGRQNFRLRRVPRTAYQPYGPVAIGWDQGEGHGQGIFEPRARGHHRRRHRRLQRRLSSHQARLDRRRAGRAQAAHQWHDVARGRPGARDDRQLHTDTARQVFNGAVPGARGRDRPGDGPQAERQPRHRQQRSALGGAPARRRSRQDMRRRGPAGHARGGQGALPDSQRRRPVGCHLLPERRPDQPGRHDDGDRQGRAHGRRGDLRGHQGHRGAPQERPGHGRRDDARRDRLRGRRQLRRHVGARRRADVRRRRYRCTPASTSTLSPSRSPICRPTCRCCATWTPAPISRKTPASC